MIFITFAVNPVKWTKVGESSFAVIGERRKVVSDVLRNGC